MTKPDDNVILELPNGFKSDTEEMLEEIGIIKPQTTELPKILTATELDELDIPQPEYITDKLIIRNSVLALGAPQKNFKSYTILDIAVHISIGLDFLGLKTKRARVLYCDGESSQQLLKTRFKQIKNGLGIDDEKIDNLFFWLKPMNLTNPDDFAEFKDYVQKNKIEIVILDVFKRFIHGLNENNADDMNYFFANALKPLKDLNLTIILLAHTRKTKPEDTMVEKIEKIRGSSEITNFSDVVLMLDRKHNELFAELYVEKNKFGLENESIGIEYVFDNQNNSLTLKNVDKELWVLSHTKQYVNIVWKWVVDSEKITFKTKEIKEILKNNGVKPISMNKIASRVLNDLINIRKIEKVGKGIYKVITEQQTVLK